MYNGSYTMMAKPIRALELHYPMILACVAGTKRGGGGGRRKARKRGKGRERLLSEPVFL